VYDLNGHYEEHGVKADVGTRGLGLAALSAATFGTSGSFGTSLIRAGWTPIAAVTARVVVAAIVLTVPALLQLRGRRGLLRRGARNVTAYGLIAVAGGQLCYFNAVSHLSVAVALLLEYSGILLIILWLWARHGHRPRRLTIAGAVTALAGLTLVLDLLSDHHLDPVGIAWAVGAAVGLAVYFVMSAGNDDGLPPLVVAWSGLAIAGVVLLMADAVGVLSVHAPHTTVVLAHTQVSWAVPVLGLSLVAAVVAYVAGIAAARMLGAKVASFVGLTEVLFAVVVAWLLLGQSMTVTQLLGGLLVVAGIALVRIDEFRSAEAAAVATDLVGRKPLGVPEQVIELRHDLGGGPAAESCGLRTP
jgi:drug/metabolite transporter (DMT)-like permease